MSAKFIITSCPAPLERLGEAHASAPTIGDRDDPGRLVTLLLYHVRQQAEKARALDGLREIALLFRRNGGDAAGYDFAALGDVTLQQLHVLEVDFRGVGPREWAGLAPAKKWTARAALR